MKQAMHRMGNMNENLTVIRRGEGRETIWKNGRGRSRHLVRSPVGANDEQFDWLVSAAILEGEQPFSLYPGIHRTLSIIRGAGINLRTRGASFDLTAESAPYAFEGEEPVVGQSLGDTVVEDFNVMTRRARATHTSKRLSLRAETVAHATGDVLVVHVLSGECIATADTADTALAAGDTLVIERTPAVVSLTSRSAATLLVSDIEVMS